MFAARVRASLKPLFHGRRSSTLSRNCEIAAISKRIPLDRFNDGIGVGIKLLNRAFHSSPQCYSSEADVVVKTINPAALFASLEDAFVAEAEPFQVEKPELSKKTKGRKTKKHKQAADSISRPKLLTEKPQVSRKTNGERKTDAHASSPARNVTDSCVSFSKPSKSSSPIPDHESIAKNKASSKGSSTSRSRSNHPSLAVVIRIGNLNSITTDSMIHSRCSSIGSLEGLSRVNEDSVDVLFRARNMNEANSLLEKLNDATVDHSQWMAEIVPEAEEACRDQMGTRISSCIEDLEKQLMMRRILVKDYEVLLHSVMHLENQPMARE
ncbi:unnamed protein product [Thlaspi arvense]|uniref:Uncharacterized protein n=1 Tax=Thlaspi arvense TaxID=13288 RepID=A0AAU9SGE4_THLAR|nr:unnamed protein product [Thlaspi arvense]